MVVSANIMFIAVAIKLALSGVYQSPPSEMTDRPGDGKAGTQLTRDRGHGRWVSAAVLIETEPRFASTPSSRPRL